jgi:hypothetical protein
MHKFRSFEKIEYHQNLHLNSYVKTNMTGRKSVPQNSLHFYLPESYTKLKFKENNSQQFTSPCNVNHGKMWRHNQMMLQPCAIEKSHMAVSHGQSLSHTGENVRNAYSSTTPDSTFAFIGGPCCPTLDFVIVFWIMITFYILWASLFCISLQLKKIYRFRIHF